MCMLAAPPARLSAPGPRATARQAPLPGLQARWRAAPVHATRHTQRSGRQGSGGVAAAAARGGGGGGGGKRKAKQPEIDEAAAFEQLMYDWDDAFVADCEDADKAALMAGLAQQGYQQHGRGFVFVRSRLEKERARPRKAAAGKGFGAGPPAAEKGTLLPNNPQLRLLEWRADYVPGTQLDAMGGIFSAPGGGAALVPDSASLLARSGGSDGGASSSSSSASGGSSSGSAAAGPDPAVLEELQRTMRGQDLSQLRAYVGLPPPGSGAAADGGEGDEAGEEWGMMGVRAYEPEAGEVVVLLAARIGGTPAVGAELLAMESADDGSAVTSLHLPDGWEEALRGDAEGGDGQQPLLA